MDEVETKDQPDENQLATTTVDIGGLAIEVRVPDENQLAMYRRIQRRFNLVARKQQQGQEELDAEQVADLLNNLFDVITSILVNPDDAYFLEAQVLSGGIKLMDLMPVFTAGIEKLKEVNAESMNRAERRAAGKSSQLVTDAQV